MYKENAYSIKIEKSKTKPALAEEEKENIVPRETINVHIDSQINLENQRSRCTKSRKADMPIFTNEYWKAMQYKEAGYIHFFLTSPMNLICLFGSLFELYFSRSGLLLLYLNVWIFLLGVINSLFYYYYAFKIRKEFGKGITKSLFRTYLLFVHGFIFILSILNIVNMTILTGISEVSIYKNKGALKIEKSSIGLLPWITHKAHSYSGIFLIYALMCVSTVALSYTEIKYKFVTENRKLSLDQIKYVAIKIATIIGCTTVPIIQTTFNFILAKGFAHEQKLVYFCLYIALSFFVYGVIGVFLVGAIYGTVTPWKEDSIDAINQRSLKRKCKVMLFIISMGSECIVVYFTLKKFLSKWVT